MYFDTDLTDGNDIDILRSTAESTCVSIVEDTELDAFVRCFMGILECIWERNVIAVVDVMVTTRTRCAEQQDELDGRSHATEQ